jgi:hypothetical protein
MYSTVRSTWHQSHKSNVFNDQLTSMYSVHVSCYDTIPSTPSTYIDSALQYDRGKCSSTPMLDSPEWLVRASDN